MFTFHIGQQGREQIRPGCCGCQDRIRTATIAPPLPCGHTGQRNAAQSHCLWSGIGTRNRNLIHTITNDRHSIDYELRWLTARLTFGTEGPWLSINLTISASPAQAAKWRGDEPFASTTFVEASYCSNSFTMSLKFQDRTNIAPVSRWWKPFAKFLILTLKFFAKSRNCIIPYGVQKVQRIKKFDGDVAWAEQTVINYQIFYCTCSKLHIC